MDYAKYYQDTKAEFSRHPNLERFAQFDLSEVEKYDPLRALEDILLSQYTLPTRILGVDPQGITKTLETSQTLLVRVFALNKPEGPVLKVELSNRLSIYFLYFHL